METTKGQTMGSTKTKAGWTLEQLREILASATLRREIAERRRPPSTAGGNHTARLAAQVERMKAAEARAAKMLADAELELGVEAVGFIASYHIDHA
jgi:hypothetical protein